MQFSPAYAFTWHRVCSDSSYTCGTIKHSADCRRRTSHALRLLPLPGDIDECKQQTVTVCFIAARVKSSDASITMQLFFTAAVHSTQSTLACVTAGR